MSWWLVRLLQGRCFVNREEFHNVVDRLSSIEAELVDTIGLYTSVRKKLAADLPKRHEVDGLLGRLRGYPRALMLRASRDAGGRRGVALGSTTCFRRVDVEQQTGGGEPPSGEVKERLLDGYERDQVPPPNSKSKSKGASS